MLDPSNLAGSLKSSNPTLDISETSFSRPGQQHASSALSTDETTVSRPDQQSMPPLTSDEIVGSRNTNETTVSRSAHAFDNLRLVPSTSFNFGESWTGHPRSCQRTQSIYMVSNAWHRLGLELGRYGRFWFIVSTWFRPTSAAFLVSIPYERHLQILDTNHSGRMPTQATSTAHHSWYRYPKMTFDGNSTINDRFPVRQSVRPTIANQSHDLNRYSSKV
ncbi:unnamed protein product [Schistosoma margrebowiei]|uniref:Uncharacterized protein n=1 Tax=Schistosoma margrebowiei TaxID=48269 RepID=A0A183MRF3_9TREM|nr:unnamed protein product [Schistosoma margrebowiei]